MLNEVVKMSDDNSYCLKCPLFEAGLFCPVTSINSCVGYTSLMIIGGSPNKEDELFGRPFSSREGDVLFGLLAKAGINKDSVFFTSAVRCRGLNGKKPIKEIVSSCKNWLNQEISVEKPNVKILLGEEAAKMIVKIPPKTKFLDLVGSEINGYHLWYSANKLLNCGINITEASIQFFKRMREKADGNS